MIVIPIIVKIKLSQLIERWGGINSSISFLKESIGGELKVISIPFFYKYNKRNYYAY